MTESALDPVPLTTQLHAEQTIVDALTAEVTELRDNPPTLWRSVRFSFAWVLLSAVVAIAAAIPAFTWFHPQVTPVTTVLGLVMAAGFGGVLTGSVRLADEYLWWDCRAERLLVRQLWLDTATARRNLVADLLDHSLNGAGDRDTLNIRAILALTAQWHSDTEAQRFRNAISDAYRGDPPTPTNPNFTHNQAQEVTR